MEVLVLFIFIIGYLAITLENPLKLDKAVPALIMAALSWAVIAFNHLNVYEIHNGLINIADELLHDHRYVADLKQNYEGITSSEIEGKAKMDAILSALSHHLANTAEILFFLMGAMVIVEIIDMHKGFSIIKSYIKTRSRKKLLWIIVVLSFILSAIIDNLTATIVLITILRKIVKVPEERLWYAGMIVIAANAGGAWSPIGDVTTTMLWIANKVSVAKLIEMVLIPSILCAVVPTLIASRKKVFNGFITTDENDEIDLYKSSRTMLFLGLAMIVFVPVFKTIFHLPPYLGMMLSLGVVWMVAEYVKPVEDYDAVERRKFSVHQALSKIEMSSIFFFLGILLAVGALESLGYLFKLATYLNANVSEEITVILLGIGSAIIDNVPLVAAAIGMFTDPIDSEVWHFLAYAAGTGGSILIIGSAAGVAAMGMERISFGWYLKNISWLAFIGFAIGSSIFILFRELNFYG